MAPIIENLPLSSRRGGSQCQLSSFATRDVNDVRGFLDTDKAWETIDRDWKAHPTATAAMQSPSAATLWNVLGRLKPLLLWPKSCRAAGDGTGAETGDDGQPEKTTPLRPTAYLDGLRGFAAFLVYWHHHELWAHPLRQHDILESGFGHDDKHYFVAYPFIRNFFGGGHFAVSTFFVISGYVLSSKPLSLIHAGEQAKLADNLGSALFRRWLRLYIPIICTTFIYMTLLQIFNPWMENMTLQSNYRDEVWHWYTEFKNFSFVFNTGGGLGMSYNFHLWSIPVEFRGSIVVYTALLAMARCTRNARLLLQVVLVYYLLYIADGSHFAMFAAGMLLCDLDLLAAKDELPSFLAKLEPYKTIIYYHVLVISLYLGGVPSHTTELTGLAANRGWYLLSYLKPQAVFDYKWFYLFWAAVLLVASAPRISWLKRFFETRFCQYLGRISYSLYLVHGPILWTIGERIYTAVGFAKKQQLQNIPGWVNRFPLPKGGPFGCEVAFFLPHLILLPLTLYCAELVTRAFDEPSVKFPQWLYKRTVAKQARLPA
ncbi:acyltransferase [Cercophora scortea]|uniref:Acyltransferase n=1 Tax=Cercophora scortea TaxID=314031 RepID=A0AAE0MHG5_9PEZI|nr:acyltransferase [Cercophora scortea]